MDKPKFDLDELRKKKILTYPEYCALYGYCNKHKFKRLVDEDGFPAIRDGRSWVMSALEVDLWWKRRGLKVS